MEAIRDLPAIEVDVENLLPADPSGHGFDNVTIGALPPLLLNRYILYGIGGIKGHRQGSFKPSPTDAAYGEKCAVRFSTRIVSSIV